jgi:hypothetical protein
MSATFFSMLSRPLYPTTGPSGYQSVSAGRKNSMSIPTGSGTCSTSRSIRSVEAVTTSKLRRNAFSRGTYILARAAATGAMPTLWWKYSSSGVWWVYTDGRSCFAA